MTYDYVPQIYCRHYIFFKLPLPILKNSSNVTEGPNIHNSRLTIVTSQKIQKLIIKEFDDMSYEIKQPVQQRQAVMQLSPINKIFCFRLKLNSV